MKRIKLLSIGLVVSFLVAAGVVATASADWSPNFRTSDESVVLAADDAHKGSYYVTGRDVTINGTVEGSLYCAGGTITINGTVEGDVLCAGQKITVNGTVEQDIRAAGQFVEVGGTVGGSLTAFGQDVRLTRDARVAGDMNGASQQVTLDGSVGRDLAIGTQHLILNGEVKGNVDVATEQLQLGSESSVAGNLSYGSNGQQTFDESRVAGEISYNPIENSQRGARTFFSAAKVMFLLMLAVSALVAVLVMPRFLNRSSELFGRQMLTTVLLGFAFVFGGPILVALLLFSVILAPIGLVLLFSWIAVLILSGIFFAYWVGSELLKSQQNVVVRMLGGIAIVLILYMLPYIGPLTMFIAVIVGSGMIVTTFTNGYRRPQYNLTAKKTAAKKAG